MIRDFAQGSTILVDKPLNWSSFDVVNKIRWHLRKKLDVKKIKVGHAGTLDPLATGLLVLCIGKHTKTIESLIQDKKTYSGKFLVGKSTPSYDLETEFDENFETSHISEDLIERVRLSFIGEQQQVPPIFSAKQIDGKRAYELARKGIEVEMKSNSIKIDSLTLSDINFPTIEFEVTCSKGTYIRSLAHDFGKKLDSGATLIELRRLKSGQFNVDDSKTVDEWIQFIQDSPL
jgi:tRNA pseudouridine55 synthase